MTNDLNNLPKRDWNRKLEREFGYKGNALRIFSVEPQAYLIGVTKPVGLLEGFSADAILIKAFEKNYKTPSKPKVVEKYGFERKHGEPIELISFQYEMIFDRACSQQMNRYRHNSKNYESGRYVDYIKHGLTVVFPEDCETEKDKQEFINLDVMQDFKRYVDAIENGAKKQAARRRLGEYLAIESVFSVNLRSLLHMAQQRSSLSPNGREAEPEISKVVAQMVEQVRPYLPHFYPVFINQIKNGYR